MAHELKPWLKIWLRDRFSHDDQITGTPKKAISDAASTFEKLSQKERQNTLQYLTAYAHSYYLGRHDMKVPAGVEESIKRLTQRAERLQIVDKAREVVIKYGGPPTMETIRESLRRSELERAKDVAPEASRVKIVGQVAPEPTKEASKSKEKHPEYTLEMYG